MTTQKMPPLMILCGGKGTRLRDVTELLPKPMVPIGDQPIIWHIMKSYAAFGVRRFILCLGYKREAFVDYFINYPTRTSDVTVTLGRPSEMRFHGVCAEAEWEVTLAGTGFNTMTGGRIAIASQYLLPEDENFFMTYGDGVADVDVAALYRHHQRGGKLLTVTAVHPEARFGEMILQGDDVRGFKEKPAQTQGYINGGFMVMNRKFLQKYLSDDEDLFLEREPMARCAADGEMQAFRHEGFWQCMDNQREYLLLNALWEKGNAPWTKYWC